MVMVAILALPPKFCEACNGRGRRTINVGLTVHQNAVCPDCDGTGDVPADYFVEQGSWDEIDELMVALGVRWPG